MLPFYPFWWSDYSGDTFSLSQGQHGAYFLLLRYIYTEGRGFGVPDKERYSIARAFLEQEQSNVDYVLEKYFKKDGELWKHERAAEIIKDANASHEKRVKAGRKGGKAKAANSTEDGSEASSIAKAKPKQPEPEPYIEDTNVSSSSGVKGLSFLIGDKEYSFEDFFERFWQIYPKERDKGSKKKAKEYMEKELKKGGKNEDNIRSVAYRIADGVRRYAKYCSRTGEKNPDAFRWLRDEGYNRPWDIPEGTSTAGRSKGYSLEAVHDQAVADQTRRPEGREERLKRLGLGDDTSDD